jgi:hypothetical protein
VDTIALMIISFIVGGMFGSCVAFFVFALCAMSAASERQGPENLTSG